MGSTRRAWLCGLVMCACSTDSDVSRMPNFGTASDSQSNASNTNADTAASGGGNTDFGNTSVIGTAGTGAIDEVTTMVADDQPNCGEAKITPEVEFTPGNLLVLFDRSESMNQPFEGSLTRLAAADMALRAALEPFVCPPDINVDGDTCNDTVTVGSILFPSEPGGVGLCIVDDIESPANISWQPATQFIASWDAYWTSHGTVLGTPITTAFERAAAALTTADLVGNVAILFMTDGAGTCQMGMDPIAQAQTWANEGIATHVVSVAGMTDPAAGNAPIGLPGGFGVTATDPVFNQMVAEAGGTVMPLNPTDLNELTAALSGIVESTAAMPSCQVPLNGGRLTDPEAACAAGEVLLNAELIECDPDNGFQVTGSNAIELKGDACARLQDNGQLSATFPCELIIPE